ncbi:MAG: MarR family transcriptional regulator [Verrucomicrobiales bacterium]|nr:MarR family transcriptional regulator [Verrucomicrobiales bacterium]
MKRDRIDLVLDDWTEERPDLSTEALGIVLRIQALEKIFAESVEDSLEDLDLEWFEYDVLAALRRQGKPYRMTASEIAETVRLSTGAMTNRVDGLEEKGLVIRSNDPADRRRVVVSLTSRGKQLVDKASETRFKAADRALDCLTEQQLTRLNGLLKNLMCYNEEESRNPSLV